MLDTLQNPDRDLVFYVGIVIESKWLLSFLWNKREEYKLGPFKNRSEAKRAVDEATWTICLHNIWKGDITHLEYIEEYKYNPNLHGTAFLEFDRETFRNKVNSMIAQVLDW